MSFEEDSDSFNDDNFEGYYISNDCEDFNYFEDFISYKKFQLEKTKKVDFESESFSVLNMEEYLQKMAEKEEKIALKLKIDLDVVNVLLKSCNLDVERSIRKWKEEKDKKDIKYEENSEICEICLENFAKSQRKGLKCNHLFCENCWKMYFSNGLKNLGMNSTKMKCPKENCSLLIPDSFVLKFLTEESKIKKFKMFKTEFYVFYDSKTIRCPNLDCENFIQKGKFEFKRGKCFCGFHLCFPCNSEDHQPASCKMMKKWKEMTKNFDLSDSLLKSTKNCPKCDSRIDKEKGCNHMVCPICRYEFCWICMDEWNKHNKKSGFYTCNQYKENKPKEKSSKTTNLVEKYRFYAERFNNHNNSIRMAKTNLKTAEEKLNKALSKGNSLKIVHIQHFYKAIRQIQISKSLLKYSYIYGFYLEDSFKKHILERLQEHLEKESEFLNEYTERSIKETNIKELLDCTENVEKFSKNLIIGIVSD